MKNKNRNKQKRNRKNKNIFSEESKTEETSNLYCGSKNFKKDNSDRMIVSRCMECKMHIIFPKDYEVPARESQRCLECGSYHVQFYEGHSSKLNIEEVLKGGMYKMAEDTKKKAAKEKAPKKEKVVKEKKAKKAGERGAKGYDDSIKQKAVELGKQGKSVNDIVKALGPEGPKAKAVVRYLKAAGVKDVKKK